MKLCKDCKHVRPDRFWVLSHNKWDFAKCGRRTGDSEIHPVSGRLVFPKKDITYCTIERTYDAIDTISGKLCGPEAQYWEEKPVKTWFSLNIESK